MTPYTGDGGASLDERVRAVYGTEDRENCASCDQRTDADRLVRTVDGSQCFDCMEVMRSEAELDQC